MDPSVTPQHIAGLVVGEGCFYVESAPDPKYKSGWRIRPAFCIEMRSNDKEVLEHVQAHLRCGTIYDLDFGRYRGYEAKRWRPHAKLRVGNIADLHNKIVPFFHRYPLFGQKAKSFEVFAELVQVVHGRHHLCPEGLIKARRLADELKKLNKKGGRPAVRSPRGRLEPPIRQKLQRQER